MVQSGFNRTVNMTTFVEPTELQELETIYCEMYKDVYGVKARWYKADSIEQARLDIDNLQATLVVVMEEEAAQKQEAIKAFVALAATYGGIDNAKRYQHQAYGTDGDDEYLCYHLGLPYGYFNKTA